MSLEFFAKYENFLDENRAGRKGGGVVEGTRNMGKNSHFSSFC
jgi:hypothetical protein